MRKSPGEAVELPRPGGGMGSWCCEGDAMTALISSGAGRPSPADSAPAATPSCSAQKTNRVKHCLGVSIPGKRLFCRHPATATAARDVGM